MKTVNKILSVLNFKQKIGLIKQFVFIIIGTMLELASIGMLFPIISILTNPNNIEKSNILIYLNVNQIYQWLSLKITFITFFSNNDTVVWWVSDPHPFHLDPDPGIIICVDVDRDPG